MQSGGHYHNSKGLEDLQPEPVYPGQAGSAARGDVELTEKEARIVVAVEKCDRDAFVRLGGATGADLNFEVTRDGATPLLVACAKGDLEFVNLMLCNPSLQLDKLDKNGVNAFFVAAYHGNIPVMRRLMEKGADMFQKNANGSNVLHVAVKRGNVEVLEELIRIQYPLNEPKVNGITALGIAAMRGSLNVLELLHRSGADIEQTSPAGIGPLYLAIKARQHECVRYLIDAGASVYLSDPVRVDYSPVFIAVRTGQIPAIELMCDEGVHIDHFKDSQGYTPLMLAVKLGLHDVVNYLTLRGVDLNQEDPQNKTLLMYYILHPEELTAQQKDPIPTLKLLDYARRFLSRGADIDYTSESSVFGQTLLVQAIRFRKVQAIEFLLDQGANPHIEDLAGMDACDHARKHGLSQTYKELEKCNHALRVKPKHLPDSKHVESEKSLVTKKQTPVRRDKYAMAYKQLSDEFGYNREEPEKASVRTTDQQQRSPEPASREAAFRQRTLNRSSKETGISMRLDEPISPEEEKSSMQRQLKSLKQRAVAQMVKDMTGGQQQPQKQSLQRKSTGGSVVQVVDQAKPVSRPVMTTVKQEGPILDETDMPAQGLTEEEVEDKRRQLDKKFKELEFEEGVEKTLNTRLSNNLNESISARTVVSNRLKNERHKERIAKLKEREHLKSSVLMSLSKGEQVTLTDIVLGKKEGGESQPENWLVKVIKEDEKDPVEAAAEEKVNQVMQDHEELEYYKQLQALDHRLQRGSESPSALLRNAVEPEPQSLRKKAPVFGVTSSIKNLRQSKSSSVIGTLQSNFGDLTALRQSRLMLNKHLQERARAIGEQNRERRNQHDDFHQAVTQTSRQLDNLTRKMQYDLYRSNNRSVLPIHADGAAASLIEHELKKSRLMADHPDHRPKPLMHTIDQYNAIKGNEYRDVVQQSALSSAGAEVIGGFNPGKYANPLVQASAYQQQPRTSREPAAQVGLDRVKFPRIRVGAADSVPASAVYEPPQHYHVAHPYTNQAQHTRHPAQPVQAMSPEKPVFVPRSIIEPRPEAHKYGIVRDLRLDKIVATTMDEHRGKADPLDNYLDLQLREGPLVGGAAGPGGKHGSSDVSRIVEMQALIEGMARSNAVIMQIGHDTLSHGSRQPAARAPAPPSGGSKRSSPSKVSFKLEGDHSSGIINDINGKLNRLNNHASRYVGQIHKTERVEQPGLIQPPMKFRRDPDAASRSSSNSRNNPNKQMASNNQPRMAPIKQR